MAKNKSAADQPLRETEEAAYHAYREWPVWLALRMKELQALQTPEPSGEPDKRQMNAPEAPEDSGKKG